MPRPHVYTLTVRIVAPDEPTYSSDEEVRAALEEAVASVTAFDVEPEAHPTGDAEVWSVEEVTVR